MQRHNTPGTDMFYQGEEHAAEMLWKRLRAASVATSIFGSQQDAYMQGSLQ